jgi:DNA-binding LacI/PurR family transcriptional regulator
MAAARELGFRPDAVARTLRTGHTPAVGLVVDPAAYATESRLAEALTMRYLLTVMEELSTAGVPIYQVTLPRLEVMSDLPIAAVQIVTVEPVVSLPTGFAFGLPVIHSAGSLDHDGPSVWLRHDFPTLLAEVMEHFLAQGAQRPALIPRDGPTTWGTEITDAYLTWCADRGPDPIVCPSSGEPGQMENIARDLINDRGVDAIFSLVGECPSLVVGARSLGRTVPGDVLVAGLGDGAAEALMTPPATVLSMCGIPNGKMVAAALVHGMATGDWPSELRASHQLIIRESSARRAAARTPD